MRSVHNGYIGEPTFTQRIYWRADFHTTDILASRRSHNGYINEAMCAQRMGATRGSRFDDRECALDDRTYASRTTGHARAVLFIERYRIFSILVNNPTGAQPLIIYS